MSDSTPLFSGLIASCVCNDREAQAVAELVAQGVDQWDASLLIYGAEPRWDAPLAVWRVWIAQQVGDLFAPLARRWDRG